MYRNMRPNKLQSHCLRRSFVDSYSFKVIEIISHIRKEKQEYIENGLQFKTEALLPLK